MWARADLVYRHLLIRVRVDVAVRIRVGCGVGDKIKVRVGIRSIVTPWIVVCS